MTTLAHASRRICSGPRGRMTLGSLVLMLSLVTEASPLTAQGMVRGAGFSGSVLVSPAGHLWVTEAEVQGQGRTLTIRGPLDEIDRNARTLVVLGVRLTYDEESEAENAAPFQPGTLHVGQPVEVRVRDRSAGLYARRIESRGVRASPDVKGTVVALRRRADGWTEVDLGGVRVWITPDTDFDAEADGLYEDLFDEAKADDAIGNDPAYSLQMGNTLFASGSLRPSARFESAYRLDAARQDRLGTGRPSLRLEALVRLNASVKLFVQGTSSAEYALHQTDDTGIQESDDTIGVSVRQLYLSVRDIAGQPVGFTVGKQRVRDEREFLFDEYLDAARLYIYAFQPLVLEASAFLPIRPLKERFETWNDVLLQARLFPNEDWRAAAYVLERRDDDRARGRDVRYTGLSLTGKQGPARLWAELSHLGGEDKGRPLDASAFDVGMSLRAARISGAPSLTLGMAQGSGDRAGNGDVNSEFRQTGYSDNSSRTWGLSSFKHYGAVLDPELSNLRILTLGLGLRPSETVSLDLVGHEYRQVEVDSEFSRTSLRTPDISLSGESDRVGWGADVILAFQSVAGMQFRYKAGIFVPGNAFQLDGRFASVHVIEVRFDF